MSKKRHRDPSKANDLEMALATLIRNTRTTRRHLSLPDIAHWLSVAVKELGDIREVAERIGLSPQMLRQFDSINDLSPQVRKLFAERQLDSVDMASHLSQFNAGEQYIVAQQAASGDLSTADIRAIREFRREYPEADISEIVSRVKSTRNVKQYVVEFVVRGVKADEEVIRERFRSTFDDGDVVDFSIEGSVGRLVLTQKGRAHVKRLARNNSLTQSEVIHCILKGEL